MQERSGEVSRFWFGHWSARGPAGLVWYVACIETSHIWPASQLSWDCHLFSFLFFFTNHMYRIRRYTRLPVTWGAKERGLWETRGHLGLWWVRCSFCHLSHPVSLIDTPNPSSVCYTGSIFPVLKGHKNTHVLNQMLSTDRPWTQQSSSATRMVYFKENCSRADKLMKKKIQLKKITTGFFFFKKHDPVWLV